MDDEIHNLAKELYQQKSVLIMGRGYHYATCLEGALVSRDIYSNTGDGGSKNILEKISYFLTSQGEKKHCVEVVSHVEVFFECVVLQRSPESE